MARGRSCSSSAKIAMSYRRRSLGQRIAFARSLTIASKPAPARAANHRWYPVRPGHARQVDRPGRPPVRRGAAAGGARPDRTGCRPRWRSRLVPAGITLNGTRCSAAALTARWTVPSPLMATSARRDHVATARAHCGPSLGRGVVASTDDLVAAGSAAPPAAPADGSAVRHDTRRWTHAARGAEAVLRSQHCHRGSAMARGFTVVVVVSGTSNPSAEHRPARPVSIGDASSSFRLRARLPPGPATVVEERDADRAEVEHAPCTAPGSSC